MSSGANQSCDVTQALFGIASVHVAEKIAGDHDVLRTENVYEFRVTDIPKLPCYPFPEPGFYFGLVAFPIKHVNHLSLGQSFKNRSTDKLGGRGSVNAFLGEAQYCFRNIHREPV